MTGLIAKLRETQLDRDHSTASLLEEAAVEIERLVEEVDLYREACNYLSLGQPIVAA